MNWEKALEIVVTQTRHERYRDLVADSHPDREIWRNRMVEKATGVIQTYTGNNADAPPAYPSLARQLTSAAGAAGRTIAAVATGQPVTAPRPCGGCGGPRPELPPIEPTAFDFLGPLT